MIRHIALYRFHPEVTVAQLQEFARELEYCTRKTRLAHAYSGGCHLPLPADEPVRDSVYAFGACWDFSDLARLDAFSQHPEVVSFVQRMVRPLVSSLAFVNYTDNDATNSHQSALQGAQAYAS